jgi:hypothetical protein
MTTTSWSAQLIQTTDAEFRAWGLSVRTALVAIGLTRTADTGQIDWTTVAKPAAGTTSQGYEIWQMTDTAQTTCPIIIKIEYGSGSAAANPGLWFTVGTASNGSGTITGTSILARTQVTNTTGADASARTHYACAQDGFFWLALAPTGSPTLGAFFGFFRYCDANGTISTNGGLWVNTTNMTSTSSHQHVRWYRPSTITATAFAFPMPTGLTSGAYGADLAVFEPVVWSDRPNRVFGMLGCWVTDFAAGTTLSITAFGSSRTFIPLTGSKAPEGLDYVGSTSTGVLAVYS